MHSAEGVSRLACHLCLCDDKDPPAGHSSRPSLHAPRVSHGTSILPPPPPFSKWPVLLCVENHLCCFDAHEAPGHYSPQENNAKGLGDYIVEQVDTESGRCMQVEQELQQAWLTTDERLVHRGPALHANSEWKCNIICS